MAEVQMETPRGLITLRRPHTPVSSPLRAWSAADALVIDELGTDDLGRLLIVNDEFGALTTALATCEPTVWTDSAMSRLAIDHNLAENRCDPLPHDRSIPGDRVPPGRFDTVIVRVPKTLALLEHQLRLIRHAVTPNSRVTGAGMVRHVHTSTLAAFEHSIGVTTTTRATRKARLIFSDVTAEPHKADLKFDEFTTDQGINVAEMPGTFSAGHVDVGTAVLLDVLAGVPVPPAGARVADLGCGNGIVAASAAQRWPTAEFTLVDVSDLAVAAARETWTRNGLSAAAVIRAADGFDGQTDDSLDIVLTNPPFHQGHALDRDLTDRLFAETARVLTAEGVAYVVVQRHLKLHATMARWFSSVEVLSKHPSHVVLRVAGV